tara:strand:+ start:155 stop:898 length:744 start_codon:yes stop_codon:yes gene_type:complete
MTSLELSRDNITHGNIPRHVAIIMDGNGRWAKDRSLPRIAGHKEGMGAVRNAIEASIEAGIEMLTLFAFSTENWQRPKHEIAALMGLLRLYSAQEKSELKEQGVEVHVLGDINSLDESTRNAIEDIVFETTGGIKLRLNLMISYSGREDIIRACRSIADQVAIGKIDPDQINADIFNDYLFTKELPDPDLLIRTSGEVRISNFMLWQIAYTEIHITPVLWPDFSKDDLFQAIWDYQERDRRFGRVNV